MKKIFTFVLALFFVVPSWYWWYDHIPSADTYWYYKFQEKELQKKIDLFLTKYPSKIEFLEGLMIQIKEENNDSHERVLSFIEYIQIYLKFRKWERDNSDWLEFMETLANEFSNWKLYHTSWFMANFDRQSIIDKISFYPPTSWLVFRVDYTQKDSVDAYLKELWIAFSVDDILESEHSNCIATLNKFTLWGGTWLNIYCDGSPY